MRGRFRHATHIVRVAALFLMGVAAFLIARRALIPADFGALGFYRAGALADARARPVVYGGRVACEECHAGTYDRPDSDETEIPKVTETAADSSPTDSKTDNKHSVLRCETCHGPPAFHISDLDKPVPKVAADKLCLLCHQQITGRPANQPQVVVGDHGDNDKCVSCHRPHRPRTDEEGG